MTSRSVSEGSFETSSVDPSNVLGLYDYINDIDRPVLFKYVSVIIVSMAVSSIVSFSFATVVGLVVGIVIVLFMNDKEQYQTTSLNKQLEDKLGSIFPVPEYFHLDINIISFFHDIQDLGSYNKQAYNDAVEHTDELLHKLSDLRKGATDCANEISIMVDQKSLAVNHITSLFESIPANSVLWNKHSDAVSKFQLLLERIMDEAKSLCDKKIKEEGISVRTRFYDQYVGPKPMDSKYKDKFYQI